MSVLQPFQLLRFTKNLENQQRFQENSGNDLCNLPVIPQGKFVPFGIISPSNVIGNVTLYCHTVGDVITYHNIQISGTFVKNDCPVGYVGTAVTYTVPAGKYSSEISVADANTKAIAEVAANGQAYANTWGTCESTSSYVMVIDEQFDNWSAGMPVGWINNDVGDTVVVNNSDRLDMTIANYFAMNIPNIEVDTGIDFGIYSQIRIRIQVDDAVGDEMFVFRYGAAISYVRNLNIGLNDFILYKTHGYDDGYQIFGIKNYGSGAFPRNIIIDYITIEGMV